jgi:DNA-binding CsgD family transcriptional regulator
VDLLERTAELASLAEVIDTAAGGHGRIVLVEGPPGIGKTALVGSARTRAAVAGFEVLTARGGELETDFAFGVVRQLFDRRVARSSPDEREALFSGAASLAAGLFSVGEAGAPPPEDRFALLHGLYWLAAALAGERPLALIVDDAHWADEPSLEWLEYLARRIEDLPVVIVLAARSTEPEAPVPVLEALRTEPGVLQLRPSPLSPAASGALLGELFEEQPREVFTQACHNASGGNPLLLTELARGLSADGISPDEAGVTRLDGANPAGIASLMLARLRRLPDRAQAMATAAAVLGDGASLRDATALAELDEQDASDGIDRLIAAGFLASGRPLRFEHPLVRGAIYGDLPDADRARRHRRAAQLLHGRSASPERIAAHLLLCEPDPDEWVVETLQAAAATAMGRGAPESAILYLRQALSGSPAAARPALLLALGAAEAHAVDAAGVEHLKEASALAERTGDRVAAVRLLALLLVRLARVEEAAGVLSGELARLPADEAEARLDLQAEIAAILHWGLDEAVALLDATLARVPAELAGATPAERSLLACRAFRAAKVGREADVVAGDALRALDAGLLDDQGPASPAWATAVFALVVVDDPAARGWVQAGLDRSSVTGSQFGTSLHNDLMANVTYREGALADAEAYAWESVVSHQAAAIGTPSIVSALLNALIERGKTDQAWEQLAIHGFEEELPDGSLFATLLESRGHLKLACRDVEGALDDLLAAGELYRRWGVTGPAITRWRALAAEAFVLAGEPARASELAETELEAARLVGTPRPIGIALRALALALDGEAALARGREAVGVLAPSRAQLEHARALCDLGAALRRGNQRSEARDVLSRSLDIASRCGAVTLAERATAELKATGARPRRVMLRGVESLTASELRVARLAAEGLSNPEIAQTLFVTRKTVEKHLGNAYGKLEIKSRAELPAALA